MLAPFLFEFLGLEGFAICPHFDFEPCHWSDLRFEETQDSFFDSNAEVAHSRFEGHVQNFSPGIENLLRAHALMEPFGIRLLPFQDSRSRLNEELTDRTGKSKIPIAWTVHERRSAQERMLKERGAEYILPIKTNAVDLPGMPSTIGYVSLKELGLDKIADLLIEKLKK